MLRRETESNTNIIDWTTNVKNLLQKSGFPDVWLFPTSVEVNKFINFLKTRLLDLYISEWREGMFLRIYREMKQLFELSPYLLKMQNPKFRNIIAQLRLSSHQLAVEVGRYRNIQRSERECTLCNLGEIEDEFHFILVCPYYCDLRVQFIHNYFYTRPNVYKLITLLISTTLKILNKLAIYLNNAVSVRKNTINAM